MQLVESNHSDIQDIKLQTDTINERLDITYKFINRSPLVLNKSLRKFGTF